MGTTKANNEYAEILDTYTVYSKEVAEYKQLDQTETKICFEQIEAAKDAERELEGANIGNQQANKLLETVKQGFAAKEAVIHSNLRLVMHIALQTWKMDSSVPVMDLIQAGNEGLIYALDKYDPTRDTKFSSYAYYWISKRIKMCRDEATAVVHIPATAQEKHRTIQKARANFYIVYGRPPTITELAGETKIPEQTIIMLDNSFDSALSLDEHTGESSSEHMESEKPNLSATLRDDAAEEPFREMEQEDVTSQIHSAIAKILSLKEYMVISLLWGLEDGEKRSLAECAEEFGVTRTRIGQLSKNAVDKIRKSKEIAELANAF